jgi:hypothetical protein
MLLLLLLMSRMLLLLLLMSRMLLCSPLIHSWFY